MNVASVGILVWY